MSPDDDETSQSQLPPNAVAYNGVLTPYSSGTITEDGLPNIPDGRAYLTTGNSEPTIDSNRLVVDASDSARVATAAFTNSTFVGDTFAINGSPLNHSTFNGSDDDIYSINEPLPDILDFAGDEALDQPNAPEDYTKTVLNRTDNPPHGEVFLTDGSGNFLTDSAGNLLTVNVSGATATGSEFGSSTYGRSTYSQSPNQIADGDAGSNGRDPRSIEVLRQEMLDRMDKLEVLIRTQFDAASNRGHNHPPELLEVERPVTQAQFQEVLTAITEIRREGSSTSPNLANVVAQASIFRRVAGICGRGLASAVAGGIIGNAASDALKAYQHEIYTALIGAAEAALAWAQHLVAHI